MPEPQQRNEMWKSLVNKFTENRMSEYETRIINGAWQLLIDGYDPDKSWSSAGTLTRIGGQVTCTLFNPGRAWSPHPDEKYNTDNQPLLAYAGTTDIRNPLNPTKHEEEKQERKFHQLLVISDKYFQTKEQLKIETIQKIPTP